MELMRKPGRGWRSKGSHDRDEGVHSQIQILENPITTQNQALGREVEHELYDVLGGAALGRLEVRFRVCQDDVRGIKFICKVENPPQVEFEGSSAPWRWWSPLMETAEELRDALRDALEIRRQRQTHMLPEPAPSF